MKIIKYIKAHFQDIQIIYSLLVIPFLIVVIIKPVLVASPYFLIISFLWFVGFLIITVLTFTEQFNLDVKIEAQYQRSFLSWLRKVGDKINKLRKK